MDVNTGGPLCIPGVNKSIVNVYGCVGMIVNLRWLR